MDDDFDSDDLVDYSYHLNRTTTYHTIGWKKSFSQLLILSVYILIGSYFINLCQLASEFSNITNTDRPSVLNHYDDQYITDEHLNELWLITGLFIYNLENWYYNKF